ncbi:MAG: dihydropteroate synthase [Endozoicomonas sp.]
MKTLDGAGRVLGLDRTLVMGVLNITPDSFYTGSRYQGLDVALSMAETMLNAGADILDVGGESTRPGAGGAPNCQQELDRVAPVVEALVQRFDAVVSVDTSSAQVMTETCKLGAGMINDVRALCRKGALEAAVRTGLPVVLMHSLVDQPAPGFVPHYDNVADEVCEYLLQRVAECERAGLAKEKILLDPGFGGGMFGKTPGYDLSLMKNLHKVTDLGFPVLAGVSRKSVIGAVLDKPAEQRLAGSLAMAALAAQAGARIIRVHDVAETCDAIRMVEAVRLAD